MDFLHRQGEFVVFQPIEVGGRDEDLSIGGESFEQSFAALGIELAEYVVYEQHRGATCLGMQEACLGQHERDSQGALLSLGCVGGCGLAADAQLHIIAMRSHRGETRA